MAALPAVPTGPGVGGATRHVLHGVCSLAGQGLDRPVTLDDALVFQVPAGTAVSLSSFRGGNSCGELVLVVVMCGGVPVHYFPLGARSDVRLHLDAEGSFVAGLPIEVQVAAPLGVAGEVVVELQLTCLQVTAEPVRARRPAAA